MHDEPISDTCAAELFDLALGDPFGDCSSLELNADCDAISDSHAACSPANRPGEPPGEVLWIGTCGERSHSAPAGECGCAIDDEHASIATINAHVEPSPAKQPCRLSSATATDSPSPRSPARRRPRGHRRASRAAHTRGRRRRRRDRREQRERRELEREQRKRAIALARWLIGAIHLTQRHAARLLRISLSTLERWLRNWRRGQRHAADRGRPRSRCTKEQRRAVHELLHDYGPDLPDAELRRRIPGAPRNALLDYAAQVRRYLHRHRVRYTLTWTRPGAVWALDFTHLEGAKLDTIHDRILVARDIASHMPLMLHPASSESADLALFVLRDLIARHGAPLVLKLDNGPAFICDEMKQLAVEHGIQLLFSPPRTPSYNGSIESGMGSLKNRLALEAARHNRAGHPTSDDLEAARIAIAECTASFGETSPSPADRWRSRTPITADERAAFLATLADLHAEELSRLEIHPSDRYNRPGRSSVDRLVIRRALQRHGYLNIRRRQ